MSHLKKKIHFISAITVLVLFYLLLLYSQNSRFQNSNIQSQNLERQQNSIPSPPKIPSNIDFSNTDEIVVMGWNVENLFDTRDDPSTDDDEYTPYGKARWNESAFQNKVYNITDIIRRVNQGFGPDILGLCEIENAYVLTAIAENPNLQKLQYRYHYIRDSRDPRGIDVALISRYPAVSCKYYEGYPGGRYILQASFEIQNHSLHIFVNHWRSRLGGKSNTENRRIQSAKKCYQLVNGILENDPEADIILLGDFNDNPYDDSIRHYLQAVPYKGKPGNAILYNLTLTAVPPEWLNMSRHFDQMIISKGLFDKHDFSYIPSSFQMVVFPFMVDAQGRTLSYSSFTGKGYSDHLPVVARFAMQKRK